MKTTCSVKDCDNDVRPNQRYCRACHSAVERRRRLHGLVRPVKITDITKFKDAARIKANNAVRSGALISPGKCERCHNDLPLQKHHHDYSKPLDVEWLCTLCHGLEHSKKPVLDEIGE